MEHIRMNKFFPILLILITISFSSNSQAQLSLGGLLEAAQEAEEKRKREAPSLAPSLIPKGKNQLSIVNFLIEELTSQSKSEEISKRDARKIRNEVKKIQKDADRLSKTITEWEVQDYSEKLDKRIKNTEKHTIKYNSVVKVEIERIAAEKRAEQERIAAEKRAEQERIAVAKKAEKDRIAAEKRAEQERIAAAKKAREEKLAAYIQKCEPSNSSNDPFASFNTSGEKRSDLVVQVGSSEMKLQATKSGCMWLGNANRPDIKPGLITEDSYQQNPNKDSQFILNVTKTSNGKNAIQSVTGNLRFNMGAAGRFMLDFEQYNCAFTRENGNQSTLSCSRGPIDFNDIDDIATEKCDTVNLLWQQNATAFSAQFGLKGSARATECGIRTF